MKNREINFEELHTLQLDMLKYIDDICRKNNIKYFLIGGSLIGAIRHKGFIPWDDDIDIGLLRNDYEKLKKILMSNQNQDYVCMDNSVEKSYYYPYIKLINKHTEIEEINLKKIFNYGVFIDIFPFDYLPKNSLLRTFYYYKRLFNERLLKYYAMEKVYGDNNFKIFIKKIMKHFAQKRNISNIIIKINHNNCKKSNYVSAVWNVYSKKKEIHNIKNLCDVIDTSFENQTVMIPRGYDGFLKETFNDYMTLPPESKRVSKHGINSYWKEN